MGWVHYCPMTCRCVWCRPASPVSAWEWELGAGREKCIAWPRCGSAWPGQPPGRSALQAVTGCHSLYTLQLSCVRRAFAKISHSLWNIFYTLLHWHCDFNGFWRENVGTVTDIIVKCFLVKIAGTEMTERPCLLSVSVMGFIRISQHIAHELEISVYYLQFTLFRLSLHLSVAVCAQSQQH